MISRPDVDAVLAYRAHVDAAMHRLLAQDRLDTDKTRELATLGSHHKIQHQELLITDLLHALSHNPLLPAYREPVLSPVTGMRPRARRRKSTAC